MCYNTKQTRTASALEARFKAKLKDSTKQIRSDRFIGFSFPETPVIASDKPSDISLFQWGLVPAWSKDIDIRKFTLNAKIETLDEKPAYRDVVQQRCLVLVDGFYEWQWLDNVGKRKKQFELSHENDEPFAMAGIWSQWTNPTNGQKLNSYSIVTTEADLFMAEIHNSKKRMPVTLNRELEMEWLNGKPHLDFKKASVKLKAKPLIRQVELF